MNITLLPHVTLKVQENESLLLDLNGQAFYELDPVGTRLWQLLAVNGDFEVAFAQILTEFEADEEELREELYELLEDMAELDLVAWE
jgi:hypothetical protein